MTNIDFDGFKLELDINAKTKANVPFKDAHVLKLVYDYSGNISNLPNASTLTVSYITDMIAKQASGEFTVMSMDIESDHEKECVFIVYFSNESDYTLALISFEQARSLN